MILSASSTQAVARKAAAAPAQAMPVAMAPRRRAAAPRGAGAAAPFLAPRLSNVAAAATLASEAATEPAVQFETSSLNEYLSRRHELVLAHFPTAMGVDDFITRVEVALSAHGFRGDNSIAMTNLCRDEVTGVLKAAIESVFGSSFNTNGLGGVLTCGVTGIGAGLSHSPICPEGRERYVFFAFPHIAIDESGELGAINRPNRPGKSCACGAMAKCLGDLQKEGLECNCKEPGVHDPLEPELTILKQRLARRIRAEGLDPAQMNLADITHAAERVITDDLEFLISKAVDPAKADYAVITGVQIHNWARDVATGANIEFVAPAKAYVVNRGEVTVIDLAQVPALTPRQLNSLSGFDAGLEAGFSTPINGEPSTLQCMDGEYLTKVICSSNTPQTRSFSLTHKPLSSQVRLVIPAAETAEAAVVESNVAA